MTSTGIKFSVCIPVYNGRKFLRETLESVRQQTHPHWELIIVEDASPKPSRDIVEAFAATVPQKVIYHVNPTNLRTAHTRDEAHKLASHPYIAPLDCDDIWTPNHLSDFAAIFAREEAAFLFNTCTCFTDVPETGDIEYRPSPDSCRQLRLDYQRCLYWTQPSSIAFKLEILQQVGLWSDGMDQLRRELSGFREAVEDRNFILRVFQHGIEPRWTGNSTTYYRQHPDSQLAQIPHRAVPRAWVDHHTGLLQGVPTVPQRSYLAQSCANAGKVLRGLGGHAALAAQFYFNSWRWYPLRIDRLGLSLRSFLRF